MTNDEAWLAALGRVTRERAQGHDDAPADSQPRADDSFARALGEPLGDAARARIAAALSEQLDARRAPGRVVPLRRWIAGAGTVAAAAAALLLLWPRAEPAGAHLPRYELTVQGGRQEVRGAQATPQALRLREGRPLELLLRPATRAPGEVRLVAALRSEDIVRPLALPVERAASGVLRVRGDAGRLLPPPRPARGELALAVCAPSRCAEAREALRAQTKKTGPGWQIWRLPIVWEDGGTP